MLEEARKTRQRRALLTIVLATALIAIIAGGLYVYLMNNKTVNWPYPCLGQESLAFHIHPWLRIWINNVNITIPVAIGITNPVFSNGVATGGPGSCFEPMHIHDAFGIIHIES